ncbi:MAG: dolichyl-phosphate-mannose--protein mannosyltransferase, partial [Prevotella sp.]|nr:dolichyl-phosphate-mannose--protein mannosyltransferase [Prevotella sp.]
MLKYKNAFWLLLIVCSLTMLPFLGLSDYHTKGEPRESIVSYCMLETGNWVLPRNNGGEMAYKPPFFHWCVAAVSAVQGKVTEGSSRLPSALALIA